MTAHLDRIVEPQGIHRRTFLADLGRGAFAIALVGVSGCMPSAQQTSAPTGAGSTPGDATAVPTGDIATPGATQPAGSPAARGTSWTRVNLGFVSAYLLVRGSEAALVDTGVGGSADEIEASLGTLTLGWDAVGHVILTHHHGDHAGSIADVLAAAPGATGYIGAEDRAAVGVVGLTDVRDGDEVFGLRIVGAPGHTPGSICVFDEAAGILVAGDAMGTSGGVPTLPGAQFTADMDLAKQSIVKLGGLTFEVLLPGHGDPIESGASALVAELGAAG
ncbi:MAG TPA: MBL fold metallo-hydrolase [Candidatus Binatia bacterium]|nr:MBL fold metallo-hydrolase [Candidatus Binatia bacterium]